MTGPIDRTLPRGIFANRVVLYVGFGYSLKSLTGLPSKAGRMNDDQMGAHTVPPKALAPLT